VGWLRQQHGNQQMLHSWMGKVLPQLCNVTQGCYVITCRSAYKTRKYGRNWRPDCKSIPKTGCSSYINFFPKIKKHVAAGRH